MGMIMTIDVLRGILGWCSVINMAMLLLWFIITLIAHDWMYNLHTKWYKIPKETFDAIHYTGMLIYKLSIFILNIIPYIALRIVTS